MTSGQSGRFGYAYGTAPGVALLWASARRSNSEMEALPRAGGQTSPPRSRTRVRDHQLAGMAAPAAAGYPPRHLPVGLGRLQRSQTAGAHLNHLVMALAA